MRSAKIGDRLDFWVATPRIGTRLLPYTVSVNLPRFHRTVRTAQGAVKSVEEVELGLRVLRHFYALETM